MFEMLACNLQFYLYNSRLKVVNSICKTNFEFYLFNFGSSMRTRIVEH